MFRNKRAVSTALFLLLVIIGSIAVYDLNLNAVHQEVVVRSVLGRLDANGASLSLGFSYPAASNGLIFFRQGESFYVFLYLSGEGTIQSISVITPGFDGIVVAPLLPLSINNYTEPSVIILQVTAAHCCFNGTVNFTVNATS